MSHPVARCDTTEQQRGNATLQAYARFSDICSKHLARDLPASSRSQLQKAAAQSEQARKDFTAPFMVVTLGAFSSGKSTLINTLAGKKVCETGVRPTTDSIHKVPISWAKQNWVMIDSPGLDALDREDHKQTAISSAQRANIGILVMNARSPLRESELPLIQEILKNQAVIVVAMNFWNELTDPKDQEDALDYVKTTLKKLMQCEPKVFPLNAKDGHDAGFKQLRKYLEDTLSTSGALHGQKTVSACAALVRDSELAIQTLQEFDRVKDQSLQKELADAAQELRETEMSLAHRRELGRMAIGRREAELLRMESRMELLDSKRPPSGGFMSSVFKGAATGAGVDALTGGATLGLGTLLGAAGGVLQGLAGGADAEAENDRIDREIRQLEKRADKLRNAIDSDATEGGPEHLLLKQRMAKLSKQKAEIDDARSMFKFEITQDLAALKDIRAMSLRSGGAQ